MTLKDAAAWATFATALVMEPVITFGGCWAAVYLATYRPDLLALGLFVVFALRSPRFSDVGREG